jgi:hypothetical protein
MLVQHCKYCSLIGLFAFASRGVDLTEAQLHAEQCPHLGSDSFTVEGVNRCPRPWDLDPSQGHAPWTHEPRCLQMQIGFNSNNRTFCLFTNADFGSGRGISIITEPGVATDIAVKTGLEITGHGDKVTVPESNESSLYETRTLPGRGVGLYAKRVIEPGQVILRDVPILITMKDALDAFARHDRHAMQWRGIMQLPESTQHLARNLAKSRGGDEIDDILQTNSIRQTYVNNTAHLAVMPEVAVCFLHFYNMNTF